MKLDDLTPVQRTELEAWGANLADQFEAGITPNPNAQIPPLMEIRRLRFQRRQIDEETVRLVTAARHDGDSWHKIGQALGTTAEAARQRYRELV